MFGCFICWMNGVLVVGSFHVSHSIVQLKRLQNDKSKQASSFSVVSSPLFFVCLLFLFVHCYTPSHRIASASWVYPCGMYRCIGAFLPLLLSLLLGHQSTSPPTPFFKPVGLCYPCILACVRSSVLSSRWSSLVLSRRCLFLQPRPSPMKYQSIVAHWPLMCTFLPFVRDLLHLRRWLHSFSFIRFSLHPSLLASFSLPFPLPFRFPPWLLLSFTLTYTHLLLPPFHLLLH